MNLHELIERYISYRQTLGERFKTNASILRAFGSAVGAFATVTDVRKGADRSLSCWGRTAHERVACQVFRRARLLPLRDQPGSRCCGSPSSRPAPTTTAFCSVHLQARRAPSPGARDRILPTTIQPRGADHAAHRCSAGLRHRFTSPRGGLPESGGYRSGECPADGPPHEVLQEPPGALQPILRPHSGGLRLAARNSRSHPSSDPLLHQTRRDASAPGIIGRLFPAYL